MNERFRLNTELVRAYLDQGDRKHAHLIKELGVSQSLVTQMLGSGRVPRGVTLAKLARLIGVTVEELLIPLEAKRTA